jgi:hypothetical protein
MTLCVHEIFAQSLQIISSHGLTEPFWEQPKLRHKQVMAIANALYPETLRKCVLNRLSLIFIE